MTPIQDAQVDVGRFVAGLEQTHVRRTISGHKNNCWLRSAWAASLLQCDPAALGRKLTAELGAAHASDIAAVVELARSARLNGVASILTAEGRIKAPDTALGAKQARAKPIEARLEDLTHAILLQRLEAVNAVKIARNFDLAEVGRPPLHLDDPQALWNSVKGNADGEAHHIETLMQVLGADCGVVSNHTNSTGQTTSNVQFSLQQQSTLGLGAILNPAAAQPPQSASQNADRLNAAVSPFPLVQHSGNDQLGHFSLLLPRQS